MVVRLFQARLVHVLMSVFSPVVVGVGVLVGDVVVRMRGVCVRVSLLAVLVLVLMRVRRVVGVLIGHDCQLSMRNMAFLLWIQFAWGAGAESAATFTAFSPPSGR